MAEKIMAYKLGLILANWDDPPSMVMLIELRSRVPEKTANHQNFGRCSDVFHERNLAHGLPLRRETARVSHRPLTRERLGPRDHFQMRTNASLLTRNVLQLKLMST